MKSIMSIFTLLLFTVSVITGCAPKYPDDSLVSINTKSTPVMDGKVDKIWQKTPALEIDVVVPDYPHFDEVYRGNKYHVKVKSIYTMDDIYFLYEWTGDNTLSLARETWYFNSTESRWMQKPKKKSDQYSPPVYEDKFAVIWEIGNTMPEFKKAGCAILCHGEYKHSPFEGQLGDTWHWKLDRTGPVNQVDDKWVTYSDGNGRKSDDGSGAYKSNSQELTTANGQSVKVPLYWIPGRSDYHWIMADDSNARKIVKIDANMDLVDEEGTIIGRDTFIPSLYNIKPATGSRGDVAAYHYYDESSKTWYLEIKRARNTGNKDDVDFTDKKSAYYFSIAVFDGAAIAHATPNGMAGTSYPMYLK